MPNFKVDCRKFQPNIFNKIKCSHCFKPREEHSSEALESNRASRKVSKCGYLFVAPDWDFSIPLYRTKRWQRRWFVLYDDGELTYSVDDLPATIPQNVIDMNRVLEVSEAEDVTGNQFALAITSADRATFVKGTCREESKWWLNVLSVFPKQHGRHKRNATFPGIKSSSNILQHTRTSFSRTPSPALAHSFDCSGTSRPRFLSCTTSVLESGRPSSAPSFESPEDDVFPVKDNVAVAYPRSSREDHKENTPPYAQDYTDHPPTSESPPTQDKLPLHRARTRRMAKREARGLTDPRNEFSRKLILSDLEDCKREEKLKDIADSITRPRSSSSKPYTQEDAIKPTREKDVTYSQSINNFTITEQVRGDPDGLEGAPPTFTSTPDTQRVDLPAEDILHLKKGWLMKQGKAQEWNKYWFVLQGSALTFYRDSTAEDHGIMDGIIDLGMAKDIVECDVTRNHGFKITMWEDKNFFFSAVTLGIRANWVKALRNAANLTKPMTLGEQIQHDLNINNKTLDMADEMDQSIFSDDAGMDYRAASRDRSRHQPKDIFEHGIRSRSSPPSSRRATTDDFPSLVSRHLSVSDCDSLQSLPDIATTESSEKASNGTLASCGETALVDLLETQVETLKANLEHTQAGYLELRRDNNDLRAHVSTLQRDSVSPYFAVTSYTQLTLSAQEILMEEVVSTFY